jgi:hypothetical protein
MDHALASIRVESTRFINYIRSLAFASAASVGAGLVPALRKMTGTEAGHYRGTHPAFRGTPTHPHCPGQKRGYEKRFP